ncbi:MAG: hypothetical protein ACJZ4J_04525 [Candidatus Poseidoniales archaeon]
MRITKIVTLLKRLIFYFIFLLVCLLMGMLGFESEGGLIPNPSKTQGMTVFTILISIPIVYLIIPGMIKCLREGELNHQSIDNLGEFSWKWYDFNWKWYLRNMKPVQMKTTTFYSSIAIFVISWYILFWWYYLTNPNSDAFQSDEGWDSTWAMLIGGPWLLCCQCGFHWMFILTVLRAFGLMSKPEIYFQDGVEVSGNE